MRRARGDKLEPSERLHVPEKAHTCLGDSIPIGGDLCRFFLVCGGKEEEEEQDKGRGAYLDIVPVSCSKGWLLT